MTGAWGPGRVVGGKYTLLGRLAVGGMAEIWIARQAGPMGFNRIVVVKRIIESLAGDPEFVDMFVDEARLGAQLSHPNIVQTIDLGEDHGAWFIVLEYLAGESLAFTVKSAREQGSAFPIDQAVRVIADVTLGLSSAHEKTDGTGKSLGIVHRDVAAQNLFITYEGVAKILDFGIAEGAQRSTQTDAGQVKGRFAYMSPEHIRGQQVDQRADVFSLAVVLYETVANSRLYPGLDSVQVMKQLVSEDPIPPVRTRNPGVPQALEEILTIALQKDRDQRYETSMQFRNALEGYLRSQPEATGVPQVGAYMRTLFAKRIAERGSLLERLSTTEAPSLVSQSMLTAMRMGKGSASGGTGSGSRPSGGFDLGSADAGADSISIDLLGGEPVKAGAGAPAPQQRRPPAPAPVAEGRLTLDTVPWTQVFLGGKKLGETPLVDVKVPAGRVELLLVNDGEAIRNVVQLEVVEGKTTTKRLRL